MEDSKIVSVLYPLRPVVVGVSPAGHACRCGKVPAREGQGQANDASMGWFNNIGNPPGPRSDATMSPGLGF
ncbi:hypothetical protein M0657_012310 [Pyricularia oryzae]|nr:hypothetical protein M0657_012310 [Pyricularia oryzae]KAI7929681.1 hypothetical protein M9X92_001139 [Pyricularia oryzae]